MVTRMGSCVRAVGALMLLSALASAQHVDRIAQGHQVYEDDSGLIVAADATGTFVFQNWGDYLQSDFFFRHGKKCGTNDRTAAVADWSNPAPSDCTMSFTNPAGIYDPSVGVYTVPVVVHVLIHTNGSGNISDAMIHSQIDVLNEDFRALAGTLGANGTNTAIQFQLATTDPSGNPSTGITRTVNSNWYNDSGTYYNTLAWDTTRYLNIYTNTAGGNLGYAYMPNQGGVVGQKWDGVRILYSAFGRNAPYAPYNLGRTATHEVGHWIGLHHTFEGGCASGSCYSGGDTICDTNNEQSPNYTGCSRTTCGSPDPVKNYMDYSEDACMDNFTSEQARRMRCTIESYRPNGFSVGGGGPTLPGAAGSPSPASGATNVSTSASLSWSAGSGATSYDVYFGTDSTPDSTEFLGNQTGLSFNPGALANSTTYWWRIDSVNAAGTTTGAVWSFTTAAGGPPTGPLLNDDLESGGGNWWVGAGSPVLSTAADHSPIYGIRIPQTANVYTLIDATGRTNLTLSYWRRTSGMDSNERLYVEWSANGGSTWTQLEATRSTSWGYPTFSLGTAANNNPNVRIRFRTNCNLTNERADVDDILVNAN